MMDDSQWLEKCIKHHIRFHEGQMHISDVFRAMYEGIFKCCERLDRIEQEIADMRTRNDRIPWGGD